MSTSPSDRLIPGEFAGSYGSDGHQSESERAGTAQGTSTSTTRNRSCLEIATRGALVDRAILMANAMVGRDHGQYCKIWIIWLRTVNGYS